MAVGIAVLVANAVAATWGGVAWMRQARRSCSGTCCGWRRPSSWSRSALGLFLLIGQGKRADDDLHYLYGVSPLVVALVSEATARGRRPARARMAGIEDVEALERREQVLLARARRAARDGHHDVGLILIVTLALSALRWLFSRGPATCTFAQALPTFYAPSEW